MTTTETFTLTRDEYESMLERTADLEDRVAAVEAEGDARVPHEVARAISGGASPLRAFREHAGLTLRELSGRSGLSLSYLSEIEHGRKPGSVAALTDIADAFSTTIDALVGRIITTESEAESTTGGNATSKLGNSHRLRDKLKVVREPRSFEEFAFLVLRATCKLFYLLEGAERLAAEHPDIWATHPCTPAFGAESWMPVRLSYDENTPVDPGAEYGPRGPLAQLAYVGWVAEIDGAWERYRTAKPFGDTGNLSHHGMEMSLMGEFHAIRNDLLKHGAVAQGRTARCEQLRWFPQEGQKMHIGPTHVIDFLHQLGLWYGHDMLQVPGGESVRWHYMAQLRRVSMAVISHRVEVEEQDGRWLLLLSVAFADGVCGCYAIETAATREELLERRDSLAAARRDSDGLRLPDGELIPMHDLYLKAREDMGADNVNHLWSPPMQFRK